MGSVDVEHHGRRRRGGLSCSCRCGHVLFRPGSHRVSRAYIRFMGEGGGNGAGGGGNGAGGGGCSCIMPQEHAYCLKRGGEL